MRKVAAFLFGYVGPRREKMSRLTWDDVDYRKNRASTCKR
jgi:acyl-CoA dehydrogenase